MKRKPKSHLVNRPCHTDGSSVSETDLISDTKFDNENRMASSTSSICKPAPSQRTLMHEHVLPNTTILKKRDNTTAVRQDPVTARAIRRLSHGVSKMSASNSPPSATTSNSRPRRCKFSYTDKDLYNYVCPTNSLVKRLHSESCNQKPIITGSKRKWQFDRTTSSYQQHRSMEIDRCDAGQSITVRSALLLPRSQSSLPECRDTHSSCSSMLSISISGSSDEHEADEEDVNEEDGEDRDRRVISSGLRSIHSCINLSDLPSHSNILRRTTKYPIPPSAKHTPSRSTGDSSDGVSVNVKVPRLASNMCAPFVAGARRAGRRFVGSMSLEQLQRQTNRRKQFQKHPSDRCRCSYSGAKSSMREKLMFVCPCESSSSPCSSASSTSNPDSVGRCPRHASSGTCEDSANDEQSDFPSAVECGGPRKSARTKIHTTPVMMIKRSKRSRARMDGQTPCGPVHSVLNSFTDDIDSELEDLLNDTWPLLSRRAQKGFVKGIQQAGHHSHIGLSRTEKRTGTSNPSSTRISFVPSKLASSSLNESSHNNGRDSRTMPTPPWMTEDLSDNDVGITTSVNSSKHQGLGLRKPTASSAPPISRTNVGHKLLERLGWEPGSGLGLGNQGIQNPVGCVPFNLDR